MDKEIAKAGGKLILNLALYLDSAEIYVKEPCPCGSEILEIRCRDFIILRNLCRIAGAVDIPADTVRHRGSLYGA